MSKKEEKVKIVFWILFVISLSAFGYMAATLPEGRVPYFVDLHYLGRLGGWKETESLIDLILFFSLMIVQPIFLAGMIVLFDHLMKRQPDTWHINVPNSGFWNRPENKEIVLRKSRALLWQLGSVCLAFFLFLVFDVVRTGRQENPAFGWEIPAAIVVLVLAVGICLVRFFKAFRLPENRV